MTAPRFVVGTLYAVLHETEWHLARWDGECFEVIGTGMQSGDRWDPEWVDHAVTVRPRTGDWHVIGALKSALQRTESNLLNSVRGAPVRGLAENLAENESALQRLLPEHEGTPDRSEQ